MLNSEITGKTEISLIMLESEINGESEITRKTEIVRLC